MDLLKRRIRKSVPNLSNLSKISHENGILSQGVGREWNGMDRLNPHPSPRNALVIRPWSTFKEVNFDLKIFTPFLNGDYTWRKEFYPHLGAVCSFKRNSLWEGIPVYQRSIKQQVFHLLVTDLKQLFLEQKKKKKKKKKEKKKKKKKST